MKTIGTMLCLASLLLLAACTAGPEEAGRHPGHHPCLGRAVATCRVVDVQDGQLILAACRRRGERRLCPPPWGTSP